MTDIKALVADLEKLDRVATPAPWGAAQSLCCRDRGTVSVQETGHTQPSHAFSTWDADLVAAARNALPALLAELHRLWAVEQERDELREAILKLGYLTGTEGYCGDHVVLTVRLNPQEANAWNTLVAKLRAEVKS